MRLFDPKFAQKGRHYLFQSALATITVSIVALMLDALSQTTLIACLGSTAFVAFAMPHIRASRPRYLLGGYIIGTLAGIFLSNVQTSWFCRSLGQSLRMSPESVCVLCGAVATGLAIFLMVLTDTEHPPAAGLALGLVLQEWDFSSLVVVLLGVASISLAKELLKPRMVDLL